MKKIQIYVHGESNRDPKLVEVSEVSSVNDIINAYKKEFGVSGSESDIHLFLEDEDEPKGKDEAGEKHGIKKRIHVHCHRCRKIAVVVQYNGDSKTFSFPPSTTAKKAMKKALKDFHINESDSCDYLLKLEDGTVLQQADHLGSYASHPTCQINLFLTPAKPVQG